MVLYIQVLFKPVQTLNMLQLTQLTSYIMDFKQFKITVQVFKTASGFPSFDASCFYSKIQQGYGPDFRKIGKSLINPADQDPHCFVIH